MHNYILSSFCSFENIRCIYCVVQQKSVLNVSKIRLRYFFAVFLVSVPSIFKKANGKRLFRTDKDVGGSIQKRVCLQTRSPQMYTDVHSWAGMSVVLYSIEFFVYEKLEVQKCTRTDISERWHPCSPLLMILSFLVTSVIVRIKEKRYA